MKEIVALGAILLVLMGVLLSAADPSEAEGTEGSSSTGQLSVVSLNLARETNVDAIMREFLTAKALRTADILLFQEVAGQTKETSVAEAVAGRLRYHIVSSPSSQWSPNQGLAIVSKYPLADMKVIPLKRYDLKFHSRVRFAVAATASTPQGTVRIWNVHLDSRINSSDRLDQLAPVLEDAKRYAGAGLIGGDLNTTKFQWLMNLLPTQPGLSQVAAVRAAFERAGFQTQLANEIVTFPFLNQHLDWIFSRGLQSRGSGVQPTDFSDHYAVWAGYQLPAAVKP